MPGSFRAFIGLPRPVVGLLNGCSLGTAVALVHLTQYSGPRKVIVHLCKVTVVVRNNGGLFIKNAF